jgi:hypothetical protein
MVAFGRETKRAGIYRRQKRSSAVEETEALEQTEVEPLEEIEEIDEIIERIQESLNGEEAPLSIADLMRLMEFKHELAESQTGPLTMGWTGEWPPTPKE